MPDKADLPGRVAPQVFRRRASPAGLGQAREAVRRRTRQRRFFPCRRCGCVRCYYQLPRYACLSYLGHLQWQRGARSSPFNQPLSSSPPFQSTPRPTPTRLRRSGLACICQSVDAACRGEVMRWRAAERTPDLLGVALLSMGWGWGALAGAGW